MTSVNYNLRKNIFLIGDVDSQIVGNKLPTNKQVLKVLFFYTRVSKYNLQSSCRLVAKDVCLFWNKAGIPVQKLCVCAKKVEKLHSQWRAIQKRQGKESNKSKELDFQQKLEMLFDIASCGDDILEISDDKKIFLANQRLPERIGFISDIQTVHDELFGGEINTVLEEFLRGEYQKEKSTLNDFVELTSRNFDDLAANQMSDSVHETCSENYEDDTGPSNPKKPRDTFSVIYEEVMAELGIKLMTDFNNKSTHDESETICHLSC